MNKRSCLSGIATGDQGIFLSRELFNKAGGFPEQALMEDIETSSRKWEEEGIGRTIFLMWRLRFLYFIGVSPNKLVNK